MMVCSNSNLPYLSSARSLPNPGTPFSYSKEMNYFNMIWNNMKWSYFMLLLLCRVQMWAFDGFLWAINDPKLAITMRTFFSTVSQWIVHRRLQINSRGFYGQLMGYKMLWIALRVRNIHISQECNYRLIRKYIILYNMIWNTFCL